MRKIIVIHQPDYLSWSGFFHRFLEADLYIALDHVQFVSGSSRSWTHRDRIKTSAGPRWLTLGIQKAPLGTPINQVLLSTDQAWRKANLDLLRENYQQAPHFQEIFPRVEALYGAGHVRLVEMTLASIDLLCELLDLRVERKLSSELASAGARNEMLVDLLKKSGATRYLSGQGARSYFDPAPFAKAGVEVAWQEYTHPVYPQLHGDFVPMLSTIDMLFNCGVQRSRELIRS